MKLKMHHIELGDRVKVANDKGEFVLGQVIAVNVYEVPFGNGQTYEFDKPRVAVIDAFGHIMYPTPEELEVLNGQKNNY